VFFALIPIAAAAQQSEAREAGGDATTASVQTAVLTAMAYTPMTDANRVVWIVDGTIGKRSLGVGALRREHAQQPRRECLAPAEPDRDPRHDHPLRDRVSRPRGRQPVGRDTMSVPARSTPAHVPGQVAGGKRRLLLDAGREFEQDGR
jgi:hypothetical protein